MKREVSITALGVSIETMRKIQEAVAKALKLGTDEILVYQAVAVAAGNERFSAETSKHVEIFVPANLYEDGLTSAILDLAGEPVNLECYVRITVGNVDFHAHMGKG